MRTIPTQLGDLALFSFVRFQNHRNAQRVFHIVKFVAAVTDLATSNVSPAAPEAAHAFAAIA